MTMTPEEIEEVLGSLEDGDAVVVIFGEGYYQAEVRGRVHYDLRLLDTTIGPLSISQSRFYDQIKDIKVTAKGEPKWHRAKVISGELKGTKTPQFFVRAEASANYDWVSGNGAQVAHDDLENVVVVASEDT